MSRTPSGGSFLDRLVENQALQALPLAEFAFVEGRELAAVQKLLGNTHLRQRIALRRAEVEADGTLFKAMATALAPRMLLKLRDITEDPESTPRDVLKATEVVLASSGLMPKTTQTAVQVNVGLRGAVQEGLLRVRQLDTAG